MNMNPRQNIGEKIRFLRLQKGMSQEQLALNSSVNISYLGQIERGEKNNCTINTLEKIATGLGCSLESLFGTGVQRNDHTNDKNAVLAVLTTDDLKQLIIDTIKNNVSNHPADCKNNKPTTKGDHSI
ncbi:helix-turn-helix transcriptional regulator [Paenibacillus sp. ISL-20]|uniref:helix-turn-helix domain-containing protein n=1 Tax=Paenibacillus sp. ISL-20 TaxID=2819163 RepID=UPI001BE734AA|nr:helix-turn-helix transcriptional regulator [Paenibacillus sp. ISL-20]MBT2762403.1 helix-turn-helix transcriptional regulator [Paenibacillus sp. ISL-20]